MRLSDSTMEAPGTPGIQQKFDSIEDTLTAFAQGNFIIVLDDTSRENEGDLIIAAEDMTPAKMAFMVRFTSGIICTPLQSSLCNSLALPQMIAADANADPNRTAYTVSIDAELPEVTTGISAGDRSLTCTLLASAKAKPSSFRRPGHIFPLRAKDGGVRERQGHTEAAVEFCRLTQKKPVGVISELIEDGQLVEGKAEFREPGMMRRDACLDFGRRWGLKVCTIEDLVKYVEEREGKLQLATPVANGTGWTNGLH